MRGGNDDSEDELQNIFNNPKALRKEVQRRHTSPTETDEEKNKREGEEQERKRKLFSMPNGQIRLREDYAMDIADEMDDHEEKIKEAAKEGKRLSPLIPIPEPNSQKSNWGGMKRKSKRKRSMKKNKKSKKQKGKRRTNKKRGNKKRKTKRSKKGGRLPPEIPPLQPLMQRRTPRTPADENNIREKMEIINNILNLAVATNDNDRNIRLQEILRQVAPGEFGTGLVVLNAQHFLSQSGAGDFRLLGMIYHAYNTPRHLRMLLPDPNSDFTGGKSLKKIKTKSKKGGNRKLRKTKHRNNKKRKTRKSNKKR
jgi:hypothetical protein